MSHLRKYTRGSIAVRSYIISYSSSANFLKGNGSSLQQSLSLCSPPSNSSTDRTTLISWLTSAYVKLAQLNHLPKAFYNVTGPTLDTVINDTLSAASPIAASISMPQSWLGDVVASICRSLSSS